MSQQRIYSLDCETAYETDVYSVADMGAWHYCQDPRFDCYMVSIAGSDGLRWTGHPRDFDWSLINHPASVFLSHNVGFDSVVLARLVELGMIPPLVYSDWHDTADLAAYLGAPRNLAGASAFLLNKEMSKEMRGHMSGRKFEELPEEKKQAMLAYAQTDADNCLELWLKHGDKWPAHERRLSQWTRGIPVRGIPVDMERVNAGVDSLRQQREDALAQIPWVAEGKKPLSRKELDAHCVALGIGVPKSLAKDSEEAAEWEDKYAANHPFVDAVRTFRRVNTFCQKLETVQRKSVGELFRAEMLYFGATTTGRWSGAGGFNIQNLPREEMFGVDLRKCFEAPAGFSFVVFDLAQIEPRCLAVMSGNTKLLEAIRQGFGIYEAYARASLGWTGGPLKEDPNMYRLAKAVVLGLGYGAGPVKFVDAARILADLDVMTLQTEEDKRTTFVDKKTGREYTPAEIVAKRLVDQFRSTNPEIAHVDYNKPERSRGFWAKCENHMRAHIGRTCEYELPSGRIIRYFDVKDIGGLSCVTVDPQSKKLARRRTWGSHITENLTQGVARDVLAYHKLRVEDSGIPVLFSVHDELVTLVKDSEAQAAYDTINAIMSAPPPWMPGLPVAAEGMITKVYCKGANHLLLIQN
jgi:DNA polymerase I-like protein with 3'-5' exonuclease and polymerase domains